MATVVPAIIAIKRRKVIEAFRVAGAVKAASARRPEDLGVSRGLIVRRLVHGGVLREEPDGCIWLDEEAHARWERSAKRLALTMLILALVVIVVLMLYH